MKKFKRIIALTLTCIMLFGVSLVAQPATSEAACNHSSAVSTGQIHTYGVSGYRCRNSTCGAYLYQGTEAYLCPHCGVISHIYNCFSCNFSAVICNKGHYIEIL